jgi:hypothetical protein
VDVNLGKTVAAHAMCRNRWGKPKVNHPTKDAAEAQSDYMQWLHRERYNAYQCQKCGWWHVGSKKGKVV